MNDDYTANSYYVTWTFLFNLASLLVLLVVSVAQNGESRRFGGFRGDAYCVALKSLFFAYSHPLSYWFPDTCSHGTLAAAMLFHRIFVRRIVLELILLLQKILRDQLPPCLRFRVKVSPRADGGCMSRNRDCSRNSMRHEVVISLPFPPLVLCRKSILYGS